VLSLLKEEAVSADQVFEFGEEDEDEEAFLFIY
jgi:hypothetical protein